MRRAHGFDRCSSPLVSACLALVAFLELVPASPAAAAYALPVHDFVPIEFHDWGQIYPIDLGTLPNRPWIIVEVATSGFPFLPYVTASLTNWNLGSHPGSNCPGPANTIGHQDYGSARVAFSLNNCDPRPGLFAGESVDVYVTVDSFGMSGQASVTIRGETRPPTGTLLQQVDPANVAMQVALPASKDTVVYADDWAASNGAGASLWAGDRLAGFFPFFSRFPRRSLLAFDLNANLPPIATVLDANLRLTVTSGNSAGEPLQLHRIAPGPSDSWGEGNAVALGDGFFGVPSGWLFAADWLYRDRTGAPWNSPGVDVLGGPLGTLSAFPGPLVLSSPSLASAVQAMVADGTDDGGFLLSSPNPALIPIPIQLASREHPDPAVQPQLIVSYVQPEAYESGQLSTNVVSFINEGQNFRWVYDVSVRDSLLDGRYETERGGLCEVVGPTDPPRVVPYTYRYAGSAFTGVDCCTWRVESPQTGTVGTGQALFFHNLDAGNAANMPPDADQDGLKDLCDNCPAKPNGPLLGTCLIGLMGAPCHSNGECGPGGRCNLSQEDSNADFVGNVCAVPEPGIALGLIAGASALAMASGPSRDRSGGARGVFSPRAPAARGRGRRSSSES